jgi:hypothetical protein
MHDVPRDPQGVSAVLVAFDDDSVHQPLFPSRRAGWQSPSLRRFWFNGFHEELMFVVAFCVYPNRQIMACAFSVVRDGRQHSIFASGRINTGPVDTSVGQIRIEIVEPMRINGVIVDAPQHGLSAELTYTAVTGAVEETLHIAHSEARC